VAESTIEVDLGHVIGREVRRVAPIETGHSGFTYWVESPGAPLAVLRLPPPGARIAGPADVARQGRIMAALAAAGLPVPRVLAMSEEPVVDGRPFVLVEKVDGERIEAVAGTVPDETLAGSAVEVLRRLHALPVDATGLGGETPMELGSELERWVRLIERAPEDLTSGAPPLADRLRRSLPAHIEPTLVHGDYHYGNLLFKDGAVAAVLDWEIAQLGQPLIDLASLAVVADASRRGIGVPGGTRVGAPLGFIVDAYGVDQAQLRWFLALAYFKLAAIFGYNLMLHRRGKRHDPHNESRAREVVTYLEAGREVLEG
jgi:aminoglycoside phosphotransferase (APT) family kinase protein